ncbi:hypothetical protein M5689_008377 [Euphorbia peplus]|nr:hypothetical protein M5689_008377 [Euphorbia peplus]
MSTLIMEEVEVGFSVALGSIGASPVITLHSSSCSFQQSSMVIQRLIMYNLALVPFRPVLLFGLTLVCFFG